MINTKHFNYKNIPNDIWDDIYDKYVNKNISVTNILKHYNTLPLYYRKIKSFLNSKGIEVINKQNERSTNHNIFKKINTEEKAYFLGLLYADGYISKSDNTIELTLHKKDQDIVEKFKIFIGADNKFYFSKKYNHIRFSFCSKEMKKDLIKLGCIPQKSFNKKFPKLPKNLISHFMRGYFDGNGSLSFKTDKHLVYPSVKIASNFDFLKEFLNHLNFKTKQIPTFYSGCYYISFVQNNGFKFLNQIYNNSNVFIKRKNIRYRYLKLNNFKISTFDKNLEYFKKIYK